ncbi:MAG: hypothetical protein ACJ767_04515 [Chloroflexota bacterium]
MDPRDRTPPFENGVDCAVCGRTVPAERIRILASRDDLTFVELTCAACRSESLGMIVGGDDGERRESSGQWGGSDDHALRLPYGEFLPADDARFRDAVPIGADDAASIRRLLERGDLNALLRPEPGDTPPGRPA